MKLCGCEVPVTAGVVVMTAVTVAVVVETERDGLAVTADGAAAHDAAINTGTMTERGDLIADWPAGQVPVRAAGMPRRHAASRCRSVWTSWWTRWCTSRVPVSRAHD